MLVQSQLLSAADQKMFAKLPITNTTTLDNLHSFTTNTDKKKKPKRNRSAFILFSIDVRKTLKPESLDTLNPNDKFVKIAQLWKEISEDERKVYEERAKQEKEKYASDLNDFCKNHPTEPIQRPRNHIKKPCNAYGYYLKEMKEKIREENPDMRMCEVLKFVGEKWKQISPEEKLIHEQKAEASRRLFKEEVSKQADLKNKKLKSFNGASPSTTDKSRSRDSFSISDSDLICKDSSLASMSLLDQESGLDGKLSFEKTPSESSAILSNISHSPVSNHESVSTNQTFHNFQIFNEMYNLSNFYQVANNVLAMNTVEAKNRASAMALQNLYWKVEKLRQSIVMQINEKSQETLFSNVNNFNQVNKVFNNKQTNNLIVKEEYKKEEF